MTSRETTTIIGHDVVPLSPSFTLILGCKGSGKTTRLFQLIKEFQGTCSYGKCILLHGKGLHSQFSSIQDFAMVDTCIEVDQQTRLDTKLISYKQGDLPDIIAVDEAQNMQNWEEFCKEALYHDKHLIATMCVNNTGTYHSNMTSSLSLATNIFHQRSTCGACGFPESGCYFESEQSKVLCNSCYWKKRCISELQTKIYHILYGNLNDEGILFGDTDTLQGLECHLFDIREFSQSCVILLCRTFDDAIGRYGEGFGKIIKQCLQVIRKELANHCADEPFTIYNLTIKAEPTLVDSKEYLYQIMYYYHKKNQY